MKIIFFIISIIILSSFVYAQECIQTEQILISESQVLAPYDGDIKIKDPIFKFNNECNQQLVIINPNLVPIDFYLNIKIFMSGLGSSTEEQFRGFDISIEGGESKSISPLANNWYDRYFCKIFTENYNITWEDNDFVKVKLANEGVYKSVCIKYAEIKQENPELNCYYRTPVTEEKTFEEYYYNSEKIETNEILIATDFWDGKKWIGYTRDYSFTVKNSIDQEVEAKLTYNVAGQQLVKEIVVPPYGYIQIEGQYDQTKSGVDKDTLKFSYTKLKIVQAKINVTHEECKLCNGNICLNPGDACTPSPESKECGSGICNIAGFCDDVFIVKCPEGTLNCNNESCLTPSIKESGEAYFCEWECISGIGKSGICKKAPWELWKIILFSSIIILILSISLYIGRRRKLDEDAKKMRAEIEEEQKEILKDAEKRKKELEKEQKNVEKELERKQRALKELEEKLENERSDKISERNDIQELNTQIDKLREKQKRKQKELESEEEQLRQIQEKIIILEDSTKSKYSNEQGYEVILNDEKYEVFANNPKNTFHRFWAKKEIYMPNKKWFDKHYKKEFDELVVHHIDSNKVNNNSQNLAIITRDEHKNISHVDINVGNREAGIEQLKNAGIKQPHIKELNNK